MEKEKATIYEYARMCSKYAILDCHHCPLSHDNNGLNCDCGDFIRAFTNKANEIILKWCEEHPIKTRQSKFLKVFPNVPINDETVGICPLDFDKLFDAETCDSYVDCTACKKEYWLAEVDENE